MIDTPISEALIVGAGIGAAILGMRPVLEMQFADFISCAFDQIVNTAATLRYRHGGHGRVSAGGARSVGRRACMARCSIRRTRRHGSLAFPDSKWSRRRRRTTQGTAQKRDSRRQSGHLFRAQAALSQRQGGPARGRFHRADRRRASRQEGRDLSIITYGGTVHQSLDAARIVEKEDGLSVEVLDLRTLLPLDREAILATARKTGKVLVVHEDRLTGGIGGEVAAIIVEHAFDSLDGPVRRLAAADMHTRVQPAARGIHSPQHQQNRRSDPQPGGVLRWQIEVTMPQMGESVVEGTVTKWLVKEGESVKEDQPLCEISTDKVDTEIPSPGAGVIAKLVASEGQTLPVGALLAVIEAPGSSARAGAANAGQAVRGKCGENPCAASEARSANNGQDCCGTVAPLVIEAIGRDVTGAGR